MTKKESTREPIESLLRRVVVRTSLDDVQDELRVLHSNLRTSSEYEVARDSLEERVRPHLQECIASREDHKALCLLQAIWTAAYMVRESELEADVYIVRLWHRQPTVAESLSDVLQYNNLFPTVVPWLMQRVAGAWSTPNRDDTSQIALELVCRPYNQKVLDIICREFRAAAESLLGVYRLTESIGFIRSRYGLAFSSLLHVLLKAFMRQSPESFTSLIPALLTMKDATAEEHEELEDALQRIIRRRARQSER